MLSRRTLTWWQAGLVTTGVAIVVFISSMLVIIDAHLNQICKVIQGGC